MLKKLFLRSFRWAANKVMAVFRKTACLIGFFVFFFDDEVQSCLTKGCLLKHESDWFKVGSRRIVIDFLRFGRLRVLYFELKISIQRWAEDFSFFCNGVCDRVFEVDDKICDYMRSMFRGETRDFFCTIRLFLLQVDFSYLILIGFEVKCILIFIGDQRSPEVSSRLNLSSKNTYLRASMLFLRNSSLQVGRGLLSFPKTTGGSQSRFECHE